MELAFTTVDVFTETRFRGNPLAIITIPASGPKPTREQKQAIAREFNLSETVFVHDVADPATNKQRNIDIFLPFAEIAFAGHPTVGTAVSLLNQGVDTLVTKAGPIPLQQIGAKAAQASIPHNIHLHAKHVRDLSLSASDLTSNAQIRDVELSAPIFSIVNGVSFVLIELPSLALLAQVENSSTQFPVDKLLDEGWQNGVLGRYYYVKTGSSKDQNGRPVVSLRTRMMLPEFEDPATGSAACCLSSFLSTVGDKQGTSSRRYEITQGVEMGKESNIVVEVDMKDSKIDKVKLAGTAVQVMRGTVSI
ncbi:putative phenazine biosynthesis protein [Ilyonectria robusta]|uniref:putative phenazine biosynthesis protein n=1 Tax=Ilyonectria robusta TaxID=1079257 RepID=UPI001E8D0BD2|nr:putative phenazine biosynthesis protein [Ilyonectria robusta]KAH8649008.1 putative phenazine biosynthesis protein [Ilyonectria robusta]